MAANEQQQADPKTEAELEAHLAGFLAAGAGLEDLQNELMRLGAVADTGDEVTEEFAAPDSDRKHWNIRDAAIKRGVDPQELAEWVLRERKAKWDQAAKAQVVRDRHVRQADAWLAEEKKPFARFDGFAQYALQEYVGDFAPGEKTVKLIAGMLKTTKVAAKVHWDDDMALLEIVARLVQEINGVPLAPEDITPEVLTLARDLISGYNKSTLKAGLENPKGKLGFYDAEGELVGYVRKVEPDAGQATRFSIQQEGVGKGVADAEE
jgi:hypothetical protein